MIEKTRVCFNLSVFSELEDSPLSVKYECLNPLGCPWANDPAASFRLVCPIKEFLEHNPQFWKGKLDKIFEYKCRLEDDIEKIRVAIVNVNKQEPEGMWSDDTYRGQWISADQQQRKGLNDELVKLEALHRRLFITKQEILEELESHYRDEDLLY